MRLNDLLRLVSEPEMIAVTTEKVPVPEFDPASSFTVLRSGKEQTHMVGVQVDHLCSPPSILIANLECIQEDLEYKRRVVGMVEIVQRGGA
jgi:hypothetical protein